MGGWWRIMIMEGLLYVRSFEKVVITNPKICGTPKIGGIITMVKEENCIAQTQLHVTTHSMPRKRLTQS